MRVFVKLRQLITFYKTLFEKIEKLETSDSEKNKHIKNIYNLIKGKHDKVILAKNMNRLLQFVPNGRLEIIDSGHNQLITMAKDLIII